MKKQALKWLPIMLSVALIGFTGCSSDDENRGDSSQTEGTASTMLTKSLLTGRVQKGPYCIGSSVTIIELDEALDQTGKTYSTTITDNSGRFEQKNVTLLTPYVELKADGYYYNEVLGETTSAPLTLYALADISEKDAVNVNILTTLERPRVTYLVQEGGLSFADAKAQAHAEVMAAFGINEKSDFESLDLTSDATLLAVSAIAQGRKSVAAVSELLAIIAADLREDGKLDDATAGSRLMNNAKAVQAETVVRNIARISEPTCKGDEVKAYIDNFVATAPFEATECITYPATGKYGPNILSDEIQKDIYFGKEGWFEQYSVCVETPDNSPVKVVVRSKDAVWAWTWGAAINWTKMPGTKNTDTGYTEQVIEVTTPGMVSDDCFMFDFNFGHEVIVEVYEYDCVIPVKVQEFHLDRDIMPWE